MSGEEKIVRKLFGFLRDSFRENDGSERLGGGDIILNNERWNRFSFWLVDFGLKTDYIQFF